MAKKKTLLLTLLSVSLFAVVVLLITRGKDTFSYGEATFRIDEPEKTNKILMEQGDTTMVLFLHGQKWRIDDGMFANPIMLQALFKIINETEIKATVPKKKWLKTQAYIKRHGIKVKFFASDNIQNVFSLCYDSLNKEKVYLIGENSERPFVIHCPGYTTNIYHIFSTNKWLWRDKCILNFNPEQIRSVLVSWVGDEKKSFLIKQYNHSMFGVVSANDDKAVTRIDTAELRNYLISFSRLCVDNFIYRETDSLDREFETVKPVVSIIVDDIFNQTLKIEAFTRYEGTSTKDAVAKPDVNNLYLQINDTEYALIKYVTIDPVLKELSDFVR